MTIQSDVYAIILLTVLLSAAMIWISKKIDKTDPLDKPKGIIVPVLVGMESVYNQVKDSVGKHYAENLTPYIVVLWVYIFTANIISLLDISTKSLVHTCFQTCDHRVFLFCDSFLLSAVIVEFLDVLFYFTYRHLFLDDFHCRIIHVIFIFESQ